MVSMSEMYYDEETQTIMFEESVKCPHCGHYLFPPKKRKGSKFIPKPEEEVTLKGTSLNDFAKKE